MINRQRFRNPATGGAHRNVINRGELPVVIRGTGGGIPNPGRAVVLLILAGLAFLIFQYRPHPRLPADAVQLVAGDSFRIGSVTTVQTYVGDVSNWQVAGLLLNTTGSAQPAPALRVRLLHPDGSLAAETQVRVSGPALESGETRRFQARLQTGLHETAQAEFTLLPAQNGGAP